MAAWEHPALVAPTHGRRNLSVELMDIRRPWVGATALHLRPPEPVRGRAVGLGGGVERHGWRETRPAWTQFLPSPDQPHRPAQQPAERRDSGTIRARRHTPITRPSSSSGQARYCSHHIARSADGRFRRRRRIPTALPPRAGRPVAARPLDGLGSTGAVVPERRFSRPPVRRPQRSPLNHHAAVHARRSIAHVRHATHC